MAGETDPTRSPQVLPSQSVCSYDLTRQAQAPFLPLGKTPLYSLWPSQSLPYPFSLFLYSSVLYMVSAIRKPSSADVHQIRSAFFRVHSSLCFLFHGG